MIYRTCEHCGAHLDAGERCDCEQEIHAAHEERGRKENGDIIRPEAADRKNDGIPFQEMMKES